jgi:CheY-like chemotaxis protein
MKDNSSSELNTIRPHKERCMRKRRAIVYDDEALITNMFRMFFSSMNYEVLTFNDPLFSCPVYTADSDICSKSAACADIILTDFHMPRMNGLQLLEAQVRNGCKLPIQNKALVSGYLDDMNRKKVEQLGCAYFHKPLDFSKFSTWIADCEERIDLSGPLASRRKMGRMADNRQIIYRADHHGEVQMGTAVDISDVGLRLKIANPLFTGQTIYIDTDLPNACRRGLVIWTLSAGDGTHLAGLIRNDGADAH